MAGTNDSGDDDLGFIHGISLQRANPWPSRYRTPGGAVQIHPEILGFRALGPVFEEPHEVFMALFSCRIQRFLPASIRNICIPTGL